jgi:hypothetical protein
MYFYRATISDRPAVSGQSQSGNRRQGLAAAAVPIGRYLRILAIASRIAKGRNPPNLRHRLSGARRSI